MFKDPSSLHTSLRMPEKPLIIGSSAVDVFIALLCLGSKLKRDNHSTMNSSTLSTGDLISLGKTTYRQKKYDVARDYFKVALTRSDAPTLDLLDHLAAVSDKLENLTESLRYGRQMIHLDDTSSRVINHVSLHWITELTSCQGYLRVGRTLHNSKNPIFVAKELALYDRAIEKVKTSDSNLKYLKSLRDGLYREQCPPNSIDPFSVLPVELAHQILEDLDFNDRM